MTPEATRSTYRRMLDQVGELVVLRRYSGLGKTRTKRDFAVQARVTSYQPNELVGTIIQGDRKIIMMNADVLATSFTLPIKPGDKVVVEREGKSKELNVQAVDDSSRRIGETTIALEVQCRG